MQPGACLTKSVCGGRDVASYTEQMMGFFVSDEQAVCPQSAQIIPLVAPAPCCYLFADITASYCIIMFTSTRRDGTVSLKHDKCCAVQTKIISRVIGQDRLSFSSSVNFHIEDSLCHKP